MPDTWPDGRDLCSTVRGLSRTKDQAKCLGEPARRSRRDQVCSVGGRALLVMSYMASGCSLLDSRST